MLSKAYQRVMGHPFVYDRIRPFLLGGLDVSAFYDALGVTEDDIVLDVGCGTGNALDYLQRFRSYWGFDTDPVAIDSAKKRTVPAGQHVEFACAPCTEADVARIKPSIVVMCGVLHHLSDEHSVSLLRSVAGSAHFSRLGTLDVVYLPGTSHWLSNVLAAFDRGRFVRRQAEYRELVDRAGLCLKDESLHWNHPTRHIARYYMMRVEATPER